jgi:hypothetical protein
LDPAGQEIFLGRSHETNQVEGSEKSFEAFDVQKDRSGLPVLRDTDWPAGPVDLNEYCLRIVAQFFNCFEVLG